MEKKIFVSSSCLKRDVGRFKVHDYMNRALYQHDFNHSFQPRIWRLVSKLRFRFFLFLFERRGGEDGNKK